MLIGFLQDAVEFVGREDFKFQGEAGVAPHLGQREAVDVGAAQHAGNPVLDLIDQDALAFRIGEGEAAAMAGIQFEFGRGACPIALSHGIMGVAGHYGASAAGVSCGGCALAPPPGSSTGLMNDGGTER